MPEVISEKSFREWIDKSPPGAKIAYYEGMLYVDRHAHVVKRISEGAEIDPMSEVANLAYEEATIGNLHLFQSKLPYGYQYIAMKASPTWKDRMPKIFWKRSRLGVKRSA